MLQQSLRIKLALLDCLNKGQVEKAHQLLGKICQLTSSKNPIYQKFHNFMTQNKQGLIQMEKEEEVEQPTIENVSGNLDESFNSDESWSVSESSEQELEIKERNMKKDNIKKSSKCWKVGTKVEEKPKNMQNTKKQRLRH